MRMGGWEENVKGRFSEADILMEDSEILVVHKHAGMAVQSARAGQMDLEHELYNYLSTEQEKGMRRPPYLAVIHRLDQPVQGVLVFGKTPGAAAKLNRQMQENRMGKEYLAVVRGKLNPPEGVLIDYLVKDGKNNRSEVVTEGSAGARRAELSYQIVETIQDQETEMECSLVRIKLKTGRHHQIRVQMAHAGAPLWGDSKYAPNRRDEKRAEGIGLCAFRLTFAHPRTGKRLEFQVSPEGEVFSGFFAAKSISGR